MPELPHPDRIPPQPGDALSLTGGTQDWPPEAAVSPASGSGKEGHRSEKRYQWKDGRSRKERPIDYYLDAYLAELENLKPGNVLVVQAETGTGKTSRLGQVILDHNPNTKVTLSQTRRPAVRMNGNYIAKEMGVAPGDKVGWRLRGEQPMTSDKTRLTLLIDQSLVNQIIREQKLPEGVIIIDEVHERSVPIDILLALIKKYLPSSPNTKVVITSATVDAKKLQNFFGGPEPIIAKNDRLFPVKTYPIVLSKHEHHTEGAVRAAKDVLNRYKNGLTSSPNTEEWLYTPGKTANDAPIKVTEGTLLMLLPGKEDINKTIQELRSYAASIGISERIELAACHGQLSSDEIKKVEQESPAGKIRIVCATEMLRSSVTVSNVFGVIDSMEVKRHSVDSRGVSHLGKIDISGAEAAQGMGRTGRERPGFYIPILPPDYSKVDPKTKKVIYEVNPSDWPKPAILREPLSSVILQFALIGEDIRSIELLDRPDEEKVNKTIKRMTLLGMLDDDGKITSLGKKLAEFTIEPERALVLLEAKELGVLPEAVILMAILENDGIVAIPPADANMVVSAEEVKLLCKKNDGYTVSLTPEELPKVVKALNINLEQLPTWVKKYERFGREPAYQITISDNEFPTDKLNALLNLEFSEKLFPWVALRQDGYYSVYCDKPNSPSYLKAREIAARNWQRFASGTGSDFFAAVNAYREFYRLLPDERKNWCWRNSINFKTMSGPVSDTIRNLIEECGSDDDLRITFKELITPRDIDSDTLTRAIIAGLADGVSANNRGTYSGPKSERFQISGTSALSQANEANYILAAHVRRGDKGDYCEIGAKIDPEWIVERVPHLCSYNPVPYTLTFDAATGGVVGDIVVKYHNVELKTISNSVVPKDSATQFIIKSFEEGKLKNYEDFLVRNNAVAEEICRLLIKTKKQRYARPNDILSKFYKERLANVTSLVELSLLIKQNPNALDISASDYLTSEEIEAVKDYNDRIEIKGKSYQLEYYLSNPPPVAPPASQASPGTRSRFGLPQATTVPLTGSYAVAADDFSHLEVCATLVVPPEDIFGIDSTDITTLPYIKKISIRDKSRSIKEIITKDLSPAELVDAKKRCASAIVEREWEKFKRERNNKDAIKVVDLPDYFYKNLDLQGIVTNRVEYAINPLTGTSQYAYPYLSLSKDPWQNISLRINYHTTLADAVQMTLNAWKELDLTANNRGGLKDGTILPFPRLPENAINNLVEDVKPVATPPAVEDKPTAGAVLDDATEIPGQPIGAIIENIVLGQYQGEQEYDGRLAEVPKQQVAQPDARYTEFETFLNQSAVVLMSTIKLTQEQRKSNLGQWRRALAALISTDLVNAYTKFKQNNIAITDQDLTETKKTISSMLASAKRTNPNKADEVESKINNAVKMIDIYRSFHLIAQNETFNGFIELDSSMEVPIMDGVFKYLKDKVEETEHPVSNARLGEIIETVLDQLTKES